MMGGILESLLGQYWSGVWCREAVTREGIKFNTFLMEGFYHTSRENGLLASCGRKL